MLQAYVGEASNLARRVGQYLNPGSRQQTNLRMRKLMDALLMAGMHVQLDVLRIERLRVNGADAPAEALTNRDLRRLAGCGKTTFRRRFHGRQLGIYGLPIDCVERGTVICR